MTTTTDTTPAATDAAPDPALVALLVAECDGGLGEFDAHLPPALVATCDAHDATFYPLLREDGAVEWWAQ